MSHSGEVNSSMRPRIFVSHASQDSGFAQKLSGDLRGEGFEVWLDITHIEPGNFVAQINEGLRWDVVILVLTQAAIRSDWVQQEVDAAIVRATNGWMRQLIVIKAQEFENHEVPPLWAIYQQINVKELGYAAALNRLIEQLRKDPKSLEENHELRPARTAVPTSVPRSVSLIGRDNLLKALSASLIRASSTDAHVLNGMGGIGKTAIAAEVVSQLSEDKAAFPGGAVWISCEGLEGLSGLEEVCRRIGRAIGFDRTGSEKSVNEYRAQLAKYLAQWPRLLIGLDNIEPQLNATILLDAFAIPGHTRLLITARQSLEVHRVTTITVEPLHGSAGRALLFQRLAQVDTDRPNPDDEAHVQSIIAIVGSLPLALELIAAYAGLQRLPLIEIMEELEADRLQAPSLTFDSERAVLTRFARSWNALTPTLQRIFAGLSLLNVAVFPRNAAVAVAMSLSNESTLRERGSYIGLDKETQKRLHVSRISAQRDIAMLVNFALIEPLAGGNLRLHPLLREYGGERLAELPFEVMANSRIAVADFRDDFNADYEKQRESLRLIEEQHTSGQTSTQLPILKKWIDGTWQTAIYARLQNRPSEARANVTQCFHMYERMGDIERLGRCHQLLAWLDEDDGNLHDATYHYEYALRCFQATNALRAESALGDLKRIHSKTQLP